MVWMQVEVVGDADEVVRFLGCLGGTGGATVRVSEGEQIPAPGPAPAAGSPMPPSCGWTEELAADFTASLDVAIRRMLLRVWRAGASGIHQRALCQQLDLLPVELRSSLTRTSHALRRFQRERGITLPRPVVSNSPLQTTSSIPSSLRWWSLMCSARGWGTGWPAARSALDGCGLSGVWKNEPCIGCCTHW